MLLESLSMLRIALLLAFSAGACIDDGNNLTARWTPTSCVDGWLWTDVTVEVYGDDGTELREHPSCGDGGFAITVPFSVTSASVSVQDGVGSWSADIAITGDVDLGLIEFDRQTPQD